MKVSKYIKLGILMVFSITAFIWGLSYLKGHDLFKNISYYHVKYDRIDGLQESSEVTLNGYKVGQVRKISFADQFSGKLIVTIMVDGDFRIPVNSVAQIVSSDIMGTKSIKLNFDINGTELYSSNDTIPGAIENDLKEQVSMQVLPLKNKAEQLLATLDSAITVLTVIFNEDARDNLSKSFENINNAISNIEKTTADLQSIMSSEKENIGNIISNLSDISDSFKGSTDEIDNLISNLSNLSDSLSQIPFSPIINSIANATGQIETILTKLNSGDGSAGKLINDEELYVNLTNLTENLDRLLKDVRMNPKRYVHISAFDLGKEVYIASSGDGSDKKIAFRINLISTQNRIPLNSPLFEGLEGVEEFDATGVFSYLYGLTNTYDEIVELHEKALEKFPEASIISFKNGKVIKLERALKLLNK